MRLLFYPTGLRICGSHINAVEVAGAVSRQGHDVVIYGQGGPLEEMVARLGIPFVRATSTSLQLETKVVRELADVVRSHRTDVVHSFEWRPTVDAVLAAQIPFRVPVVSTVYSMSVPQFFPTHVPLVVGTHVIADAARRRQRAKVSVIEPPVDLTVHHNAEPSHRDDLDTVTVVIVSRLHPTLKLTGILEAVEAVDQLAQLHPERSVELVVVGDGPSSDAVRGAAEAASARGHAAVRMIGAILDPTPYYRMADIVIGMGHSALRAMASGKPTIIQGEDGFWELVTALSAPTFLRTGWYGIGSDEQGPRGLSKLLGILHRLVQDPACRAHSAETGRRLTAERFCLERAAARQIAIYEAAVRQRPSRAVALVEAVRMLSGITLHSVRSRLSGDDEPWDFNRKHVQPLASFR
ncbi:glycosyltransferase family 4 protein [Lentzea alba]|uniref:glycosyltransferase family 4 protein n=1 Tax=Lentzea alba TaxID=2714351 RepID=UPI0039BFFDE7